MLVTELIEELKKYPPTASVVFIADRNERVVYSAKSDTVCIYGPVGSAAWA